MHIKVKRGWTLALGVLLGSSSWCQVPVPQMSPAPVLDYEYDATGNLTRIIKAKSQGGYNFTTVYGYDSLNRRRIETDARGKISTMGYLGADHLLQVTDPRSLITQYQRNGHGQITAKISPDSGSSGVTVDALGNVRTILDSRGILSSLEYDGLNRLRSVTHSGSNTISQTFVWNYDQTGSGFSYGIGRLTSIQFPAGYATYAYDAQGRTTLATQVVSAANPISLSVGYGYDTGGNVTQITYPSGRVLHISYTGGLATAMSVDLPGSGNTPLISDLQFEPSPGGVGAARSWNFKLASGNMPNVRVFDSFERLVRHPLGGALRDITYDAADRVAAYTHWNALTGSSVTSLNQSFGYDELGRLVSYSNGQENLALGYDDNGNRTLTTLNSANASSVRNSVIDLVSNRLLSTNNPPRSFVYDAAGNMERDVEGLRTEEFTIDASGRIGALKATADGLEYAVTGYEHNVFGQRIMKVDLGNETCSGPPSDNKRTCDPVLNSRYKAVIFVYDQQGRLLGEYTQDGTMIKEYVWLQGMPVVVMAPVFSGTLILYVHTDHLDTPRVAIDRSGVQRWSMVGEPFGHSAPNEGPVPGYSSVVINLRMPGQYFDLESGLSYNYFRSYDPSLGRYTQSDPIGLAGGINTYSYVGGNPISFIDPMGLDRWGDTSANYRYTPTAGGQVNDATGTALTCFSICVGGSNPGPGVTVTAGREGGHSTGSAHEAGQACDVGKNSNPNLTRAKTEQCFKQCFPASTSWGQEEGNHFHMQTRPGRNGGTGFIPGVH